MHLRVNCVYKRGSDAATASRRKSVPGAGPTRDLAPTMDADGSYPREGQSGDGDEPEEQFDAHVGVRVPQNLVERYDEAAFHCSSPGRRVSRSDLFREALFQFIDELEEDLDQGAGDDVDGDREGGDS